MQARVSVTNWVTSPVGLDNLRDELLSDPVTVHGFTVYCSCVTVCRFLLGRVGLWQWTMALFLASS